jgi:hypothetical protein
VEFSVMDEHDDSAPTHDTRVFFDGFFMIPAIAESDIAEMPRRQDRCG